MLITYGRYFTALCTETHNLNTILDILLMTLARGSPQSAVPDPLPRTKQNFLHIVNIKVHFPSLSPYDSPYYYQNARFCGKGLNGNQNKSSY